MTQLRADFIIFFLENLAGTGEAGRLNSHAGPLWTIKNEYSVDDRRGEVNTKKEESFPHQSEASSGMSFNVADSAGGPSGCGAVH